MRTIGRDAFEYNLDWDLHPEIDAAMRQRCAERRLIGPLEKAWAEFPMHGHPSRDYTTRQVLIL